MEKIKILDLDTFEMRFDPDQVATKYHIQFPDITIKIERKGPFLDILSMIEPGIHAVSTLPGLGLKMESEQAVPVGDIVARLKANQEKFREFAIEYQALKEKTINANSELVASLNLVAMRNYLEN